jgi:DNA modification methylase
LEMNQIVQGDALESLRAIPSQSVHCCVTSPPYWGLRDYGVSGQLGLEPTPQEYVSRMVDVFREVRRVLRDDGTLWLNLGDSYAANRAYQVPSRLMNGDATNAAQAADGHGMKATDIGLKPKDLVGIPWRVAFALQEDGWYLRQDIIWHKPNPMPESVTDRCTKAHEYIFLMAKSERYYYDQGAVKEGCASGPSDIKKMVEKKNRIDAKHFHQDPGAMPAANPRTNVGNKRAVGSPEGRNRRSVWTVATHSFSGAHFATFPPDLIKPCILAGCPEGGTVLDPFFGSGTTGVVATQLGREYLGIELKPSYVEMAKRRILEEGDLTLSLFTTERLGVVKACSG